MQLQMRPTSARSSSGVPCLFPAASSCDSSWPWLARFTRKMRVAPMLRDAITGRFPSGVMRSAWTGVPHQRQRPFRETALQLRQVDATLARVLMACTRQGPSEQVTPHASMKALGWVWA